MTGLPVLIFHITWEVAMKGWRWIWILAAFVCMSHSASAHRPVGWSYFSWPYAYESSTRTWFYYNASDYQWCADMSTGRWQLMGSSGVTSGWTYWQWPYAFNASTGRWYFMANNNQWFANLASGQWRRLGDDSGGLPAGKVLYVYGYDDGGSPTILMETYWIVSGTVIRDVRSGKHFTYSLAGLGGSAVRLRIYNEQDGGFEDNNRDHDDETTFDLTYQTSSSGLVRNAASLEYQNGILIDRWGMRNGTFNFQ